MKILMKVLITAVAVLSITFSQAQDDQIYGPDNQNEAAISKKDVRSKKAHDRKQKIKEELQLSDAQVAQWESINEKYQPQIKELKQEMRNDREQSKEEMKELLQSRDAEFVQILDGNQQEKWADMKAEFKEKRQERRGKRG